MLVATVFSYPVRPPVVLSSFRKPKLDPYRLCFSYRPLKLKVSAAKEPLPGELQTSLPDGGKSFQEENKDESVDFGWLPAFPHVLLASMSNFLFGYHIGVMNGPIVSVARELGFEGDPILEGLVVSIFIAGAFIGSISCGSLVDKLGCRRTFQVDTIPLILGAFISAQAHSLSEIFLILQLLTQPLFCNSAQAHSLSEILLGRFLVGLGIGVNTVLLPIYISEVAPTKYRGSLGTLNSTGTCLGIIASLFLGIPSETDPHWWRTILYIAAVPAFALSLGMQFSVESPRWLCKVGRLDDAKEVICKIWGPSEVERAMENFQSVIKDDGSDAGSRWLELLEEPHSRVAFVGGSLYLLQQFAGINGILYFSSLTFKDVGVASGALASLFVGLTNFAGSLCASYLMDKEGRKKLLVSSYLGMAVSMLVAACAISFPVDEDLSHNLSVIGILIRYHVASKIITTDVEFLHTKKLSRGLREHGYMGMPLLRLRYFDWIGTSVDLQWWCWFFLHHNMDLDIQVCNFLVGLFFLNLIEIFGVAPVYSGFGSVSVLAAIFAYYFIVETRGRSLEEIEMSLNPNLPAKDKQ
ncbi:probable plastidic glucose transporter 1 isoform X3 [Euphorbia lathyris]|uniref:probable plastidic glucose transporter 1 isoform X3 n=1 Tax=Euphorbia lathyris TaxID=212925 RepID=UPI003313B59C